MHHTTISRRLARISQELAKDLRKRLHRALAAGDSTLDSIIRLAQSRIDVTIAALGDPGKKD